MYKNVTENIEVYFICQRREDMNLIETYYDEELDIHYWYFNSYLAYKSWKNKFKDLKPSKMLKNILTIAASRYLLYRIETSDYKTKKEETKLQKELEKISPDLERIIKELDFFP